MKTQGKVLMSVSLGALFGAICGAVAAFVAGASVGAGVGVAAGAIFALYLAVYMRAGDKKTAERRRKVCDRYDVVFDSAAARRLKALKYEGGWLFLTKDELIFMPAGDENLQVTPLEDIVETSEAKFVGSIPEGVSVKTAHGEEIFSLEDRKAWIDGIGREMKKRGCQAECR